METIAHLDEEFARIQVVGAAKGETVVEEDAAVGEVQSLNVYGEAFAEAFSKREVDGGVRLEMRAGDG